MPRSTRLLVTVKSLHPLLGLPPAGDRCRRGHLRTEENTYRDSAGNRRCNDCRKFRRRQMQE